MKKLIVIAMALLALVWASLKEAEVLTHNSRATALSVLLEASDSNAKEFPNEQQGAIAALPFATGESLYAEAFGGVEKGYAEQAFKASPFTSDLLPQAKAAIEMAAPRGELVGSPVHSRLVRGIKELSSGTLYFASDGLEDGPRPSPISLQEDPELTKTDVRVLLVGLSTNSKLPQFLDRHGIKYSISPAGADHVKFVKQQLGGPVPTAARVLQGLSVAWLLGSLVTIGLAVREAISRRRVVRDRRAAEGAEAARARAADKQREHNLSHLRAAAEARSKNFVVQLVASGKETRPIPLNGDGKVAVFSSIGGHGAIPIALPEPFGVAIGSLDGKLQLVPHTADLALERFGVDTMLEFNVPVPVLDGDKLFTPDGRWVEVRVASEGVTR